MQDISPTPQRVRVALFGGPRLFVDSSEVPVPTPRDRLVLARIAAERGAVTTEDLLHLIWQNDAPSTARNQLHASIGRLRRLLAPEDDRMRATIAYGPGGYELDTGIAVDVHEAAPDAVATIEAVIVAVRTAVRPPGELLPEALGDRDWLDRRHRARAALIRAAADLADDVDAARRALDAIAAMVDPPRDEGALTAVAALELRAGRLQEAIRTIAAARAASDAVHPETAAVAAAIDADARHTVPAEAAAPAELRRRIDAAVLVADGDRIVAVVGPSPNANLDVAVEVTGRVAEGRPVVAIDGRRGRRSAMPPTPDGLAEVARSRIGILTGVLVRLDDVTTADHVRAVLETTGGGQVVLSSRADVASLVVREGAVIVRTDA